MIFAKIKLKFFLNWKQFFVNEYLGRCITTSKKILDCPNYFRFDGSKTPYGSVVHGWIFVGIVLINRLSFLQNDILVFLLLRSQQIFFCRTTLSVNFSGKGRRIANLGERWSRNVDLVQFFPKTSGCLSFFKLSFAFLKTCKDIPECQLSHLFARNGLSVSAICQNGLIVWFVLIT